MSIEINARQIEEVKALLQNPQGLTLKLLEDEHKVSSKTIIRDVQILKDFFAAYGILLLKQKNSVLLDSREPGNWDTLLQYLREIEPANNILNIQGRRKSIYFNLLYNSPSQTSISTLAEEFLVSRSSIASDLSAIKQWAEEHNLSLIQSTKGTYIEGNEVLIRSEIARMIGFLSPKDLIAKYDGDIEMVVLKRMDKKVYAVLNKIYGSAWITAITDFVNAIEESIGYLISDVYYGNMIVNILVALGRIKQGRKVHETQYDTELEMIDGETFNLIKGKFEDLKSTLDVDMSVQEYMYIFTFLISTGIAAFDNKMVLARYYSGVEHISEFFCNELISEIEKSVKIRINRGTDLYRFFLLHINSLINRLKYHIMINNILKQSIINDYPGYYNLLRKGFNKILSLYPIAKMISDDEICFLVPYVHAMIEESKAKPRIVIVCIEGIGTSHIIETQIKKLFPWIEIVASVPKSKLRQFDFSGIDYIITTISVAASVNVPSIIVSPLLSESDIGNINKIIKR